MSTGSHMTLRERVALAVSGGVVLFMVVYWTLQVIGVIEQLRLAYG